ncbi:hypothetical protein [Nocardioides stalactiti]|uniref:hypothetical protein n=1 Tax=Nocardioides stalactiti TaxID=2755356 RepID=UPI001603F9EB|nr:hypothetical protein [Nocardioides stalactiti]
MRRPGAASRSRPYADRPTQQRRRSKRKGELVIGYFDSLKPPAPTVADPPKFTIINGDHDAAPYALAALRGETELVATAPEGTRNHALNKAWFNMGRHIGAGTITQDLVRTTLADAARKAGLPQHEIDTVLRDDDTSAMRAGAQHPRTPTLTYDPQVTIVNPTDLTSPAVDEDAFWGARPILTHLHTFARARRVSPWAVLGVALARIITATPHQVCIPPIVGGRASLNLFIGLVGPSGAGKGAAEAVAADALHVGYITSHNVGSGEGIAHGYKRRVKGDLEWLDDRHAVLFSVPEIDSLAAQGDRRGATLMPQLRSGWTGEQLGFGYADPTKRIIVEAHQYRMCLVAGIQPGRAACLLDDADGGTPQRFLWMPATDPDAPTDAPDEPKPWTWNAPYVSDRAGHGGIRIGVCDTAKDTVVEARLARLRGHGEALDGHALLARLKTAAALALADQRLDITGTDWDLAGIVQAKSDATRARVVATLQQKTTAANTARADAEAARAVHVDERLADAAVQRACRGITRKLRREGDWTSRKTLRGALPGRDREHFDPALDRLIEAGQIEHDAAATGHGNTTGKYRLRADS